MMTYNFTTSTCFTIDSFTTCRLGILNSLYNTNDLVIEFKHDIDAFIS